MINSMLVCFLLILGYVQRERELGALASDVDEHGVQEPEDSRMLI